MKLPLPWVVLNHGDRSNSIEMKWEKKKKQKTKNLGVAQAHTHTPSYNPNPLRFEGEIQDGLG